jgi:uncharacterized phage infection (PIP) family protein YhgE
MITELMRRSLRGGILKVGEELSTFVSERVDTTLTERLPEVERAAVTVAEETAQIAAAKVAAEEVHALEAKTTEVTGRLASQIDEAHKKVEEKTESARRELSGRIEEATRRAQELAEEKARGLVTQIEQVEKKAHTVVEEKAQTLVRQIEEVDRRAVETTRQTAEQLNGKIVETEKRVCETTQAEINQRLTEVLEKAREGAAILKSRLKAVEELAESLRGQLHDEQAARKQELHAGFAKLHTSLDQLSQKLAHGIELCQARMRDEMREVRKAHEELAARVAALEQPKGFFSRLFGRKKDKAEKDTPEKE